MRFAFESSFIIWLACGLSPGQADTHSATMDAIRKMSRKLSTTRRRPSVSQQNNDGAPVASEEQRKNSLNQMAGQFVNSKAANNAFNNTNFAAKPTVATPTVKVTPPPAGSEQEHVRGTTPRAGTAQRRRSGLMEGGWINLQKKAFTKWANSK